MTDEPTWLRHARAEVGVRETPGPKSTPRILEYRRIGGIAIGGDDGAVPWCAIFVCAMLRLAGLAGGNAMARSFVRWGVPLPDASPGAIVPLSSSRGPTSGHVGIATGRVTRTHVELVSGNANDAVTVDWWPKARVLAYRWPAGVAMPAARAHEVAAAKPLAPIRDA